MCPNNVRGGRERDVVAVAVGHESPETRQAHPAGYWLPALSERSEDIAKRLNKPPCEVVKALG